jgi:hypothetical protein
MILRMKRPRDRELRDGEMVGKNASMETSADYYCTTPSDHFSAKCTRCPRCSDALLDGTLLLCGLPVPRTSISRRRCV